MNDAHTSNKTPRLLTVVVILLCVVMVLQLGVLLHRQVVPSLPRPSPFHTDRPAATLIERAKSWIAPHRQTRVATPDTVWNPADQMAQMHEQINSMMDQAFHDTSFPSPVTVMASNATASGNGEPAHWRHIDEMRRQIDALFAGAMGDFQNQRMGFEEGWADLSITPSLSIRDTEATYEITLQLPGIDKSGIQVTMDGTILDILVALNEQHVSSTNADGGSLQTHRVGQFERRLRLPSATSDHASIKASFEGGVLRIVVPKATDDKSTVGRIKVS